jgi:hypothetical protein
MKKIYSKPQLITYDNLKKVTAAVDGGSGPLGD